MFNGKVKGPALKLGDELVGMGQHLTNYRPMLWNQNGSRNFIKLTNRGN